MPALPSIRPAQPRDAAGIARVHVAGWRAGYRGLIPDSFLDALDPAQREAAWRASIESDSPERLWIAEANDTIVGLVCAGPSRDEDEAEAIGEIWALYVDPAHWGRGVGTALLLTAIDALERDHTEVSLWLLARNHRARRFYEDCGFRDDGARKTIILGRRLPEMRLRRPLSLLNDRITRRPSVRGLLIDRDGSILLFGSDTSHLPHLDGQTLWMAPGGRPEGDESAQECLRRELWEETGLRLTSTPPATFLRRHIWSDGETTYESVEPYFPVHVDRFEPDCTRWTADERRLFRAHRWWSRGALRRSKALLVPRNLAALTARAADPPSDSVWPIGT